MVEARAHSLSARPAPISREPEAEARAHSSPIAFFLGVTWLTVILSGVTQWAVRGESPNAYYIFMGCFLPYFLIFRLPQVARLATYPQFWLWVLSAGLPMLLFLLGQNDPWARAIVKSRIMFFSIVAGSALVLVAPDARRMLRTSALIVLSFAIPICLIELVVPNIFSTSEGRSAGLYGNPNDASAALLICLLFALDDVRRVTNRGLVLLSVGTVAVITTFSRHGMIFAAALWAWYALLPGRGRSRDRDGQQRLLVLLGVVAVVVVGGALVIHNVNLNEQAIGRLRSLLLGDVSDASTMGRLDKARSALEVIRGNFWGRGIGFGTRNLMVPHNTFLYFAIDYGIPGALFYLTILAAGLLSALRAGWARAANAILVSLLLFWSSLFTHYAADTGFFSAAFAALATGALILPREGPRDAERRRSGQ